MSIPKEPRQLMINLMYLVLIALLALNVSAEILNAFDIVNVGIKRSVDAIEGKNNSIIAALEEKAENDETAVKWRDLALQARELSNQMNAEVDNMIEDIYEEIGYEVNPTTGERKLKAPGDTHKGTNYMLNRGNGAKLKDMINNGREQFMVLVGDAGRAELEGSVAMIAEDPPIKEGVEKNWAQYNFGDVPAIAAITILNKIKNDIKSTETDVLEFLGKAITAQKFTFDALKGRAISNKSYINVGENYEADIFVSATSTSTDPIVHIGQFDERVTRVEGGYEEIKGGTVPLRPGYQTLSDAQGGIVKYAVQKPAQGEKKYSGVIEIKNPNTGETSYYPFEGEYNVAPSMAVVSPDMMNVFYIGVDNPVTISAPGYQPQQIIPSISSGTLAPAGAAGKYNVKVTQAGEVKVSVSARAEGGTRYIGDAVFRVKRIPDPTAFIGQRSSGVIPAGELRSMQGVRADAPGFDFNVRFTVQSFDLSYKKARTTQLNEFKNTGPGFSQQIQSVLNQANAGDQLWLDNIRVAAPDGTTRTLFMSLKVM